MTACEDAARGAAHVADLARHVDDVGVQEAVDALQAAAARHVLHLAVLPQLLLREVLQRALLPATRCERGVRPLGWHHPAAGIYLF